MDLHPVVASQLSSRGLVLTTTLLISSLVSSGHYQLRADINCFRVQLRLLLTPSIPPRRALLRLLLRSVRYCEPPASIIRFQSILHVRSGYPEPAQEQEHLFWQENLAVSFLSESCTLSLSAQPHRSCCFILHFCARNLTLARRCCDLALALLHISPCCIEAPTAQGC